MNSKSLDTRLLSMMEMLKFSPAAKKVICDRVMDSLNYCDVALLKGKIEILTNRHPEIVASDFLEVALKESGITAFVKTRIPIMEEIRLKIADAFFWDDIQDAIWERVCNAIRSGNLSCLDGDVNYEGQFEFHLSSDFVHERLAKCRVRMLVAEI